MQKNNLLDLTKEMKSLGASLGYKGKEVVVNDVKESQKYLLISQDPSLETDKTKGKNEAHSGFEERTLALFFFGSDDSEALNHFGDEYSKFKRRFFDNIYWTHCSKVHVNVQMSKY